MDSQTIPMQADQSLEIRRAGGSLLVQGWDRAELEARADALQCEQAAGTVVISSSGDLVLSVPRGVRLVIGTIGGDVRLEDLEGTIDLSVIGGDALLRNLAGAVALNGPVGGETRLDNVARVSMAGGRRRPGADLPKIIQRGIEQTQRHVERQRRRAEEKLRHAEKKLDRVRPIIGGDPGRWLGSRGPAPVRADSPADRVSDEERIAILKMLQAKKITSEQADELLQALEAGA